MNSTTSLANAVRRYLPLILVVSVVGATCIASGCKKDDDTPPPAVSGAATAVAPPPGQAPSAAPSMAAHAGTLSPPPGWNGGK